MTDLKKIVAEMREFYAGGNTAECVRLTSNPSQCAGLYAGTWRAKKWADALDALAAQEPFQSRVEPWLLACFGEQIANDIVERNHRFAEEALELVQSLGCTRDDAHALVGYVFGRPAGEPRQEVGGVMVTLAALCRANGIDMHEAGDVELARIWTKVDAIREKQKRKPAIGPLPGVYADRTPAAPQPAPPQPPSVSREALVAAYAELFNNDDSSALRALGIEVQE